MQQCPSSLLLWEFWSFKVLSKLKPCSALNKLASGQLQFMSKAIYLLLVLLCCLVTIPIVFLDF